MPYIDSAPLLSYAYTVDASIMLKQSGLGLAQLQLSYHVSLLSMRSDERSLCSQHSSTSTVLARLEMQAAGICRHGSMSRHAGCISVYSLHAVSSAA